jgi:hypothetical protein
VVEQHASVTTSAIFNDRCAAGILINPLDAKFRPTGSQWFPVTQFQTLKPLTAADWTIRIAPGAIARIEAERAQALPNETGGYLYGSWDPPRHTITILYATGLPPGSVTSPATAELGPAGRLVEERRLTRRTHNRIYLCGTWHSHTKGSARMSGRDHRTIMEHHTRDAARLSPTLLIIAAQNDIQAHLKVP